LPKQASTVSQVLEFAGFPHSGDQNLTSEVRNL
jgi:hypothetical protein